MEYKKRDLGLVVDEDQSQFPDLIGLRSLVVDEGHSNEFPDQIELVFKFELFEGMVVIELAFVFELFQGMVAFELFIRQSFDFPDGLDFFHLRTLRTLWRRGRLWTVRWTDLRLSGSTWIYLVFKLVVVFELVNVFKLFDRPSTFQIWIFSSSLRRRGHLWTVRLAFNFPNWNFSSFSICCERISC